jgi:hypothetical protein
LLDYNLYRSSGKTVINWVNLRNECS